MRCIIGTNLLPTCTSTPPIDITSSCQVSPCLNGGYCIPSTDKCTCPTSYTGTSCETNYFCSHYSCPFGQKCAIGSNNLPICLLSLCSSISCLNGGLCIENIGVCICNEAHTGKVCETLIV